MVTSLLQLYIQASDCYHAENSPGLNLVQTLGRKKRLIHSIEDRVFPPFPCSPARDRPSDQQPPLPFPLSPAPPAPAPIAGRSFVVASRPPPPVRSFLLQRFVRRLQLHSPDRRLIRRVRERKRGTFTPPPSIYRPSNRAPLRNNNKALQLQSKSQFPDKEIYILREV